MTTISRRDFGKSVGLFAGYIALGAPGVKANEPLIITPAEYQEEVRQRTGVMAAVVRGDVAQVAVLNSKGEIVGANPFTLGPRHIDWGDTLEVTLTGEIKCRNCGAHWEDVVIQDTWHC